MLRREGLYSSHITEWRKARDAGALAGLAAPRGRKRRDPQAKQIARLEAEKLRLEQELAKARAVVDVRSKLYALLETLSESADTSRGRRRDRPGHHGTDTAAGRAGACEAVGAARARLLSAPPAKPGIGAASAHPTTPTAAAACPKLSTAEQQAILDVLHSDRFDDLAPAEVWATLLDEGVYLGSESTFYRLLRQAGEVREHRRQAAHLAKAEPELTVKVPNALRSWDITKLRGPAK